MQTATADPLVGRTLEGRYRILGRVARGGMSVVYEAVDQRLDRLVAVKVMAAALSADPAFSDRFSREARAAARLSHTNAVAVFDQGEDEATGHVFLVMELVDGRTLREYIRERQGRFSPAEAVSIMEPVLAALAAAHRAGIVHRDVKPENILLSDDGVVKVADFGLARAIESNAESTRTGLMMGTVAYCSPEQITRGQGDQRSDVYSAGIVLFELLTGAPPFTGESAMNVAYQHVHHRVPAPSSVNHDVPEELDEVVVAATDSDPAGRPADAADLLAELADIRTRLALPVVPVPPRERRPAAQPERKISPTAATGVIAAASARAMPPAGLGGPRDTKDLHPSLPGPGRPPQAAQPPPRPRRPLTKIQRARRRGLIAVIIVLLLGLAGGLTGWWLASGRYSRVPDVAGRPQSEAVQAIIDAGYKTGTIHTGHSHTVRSGTVISTSPEVGSRLERGKTINLEISSGRDMITVPTVAKGTLKDQVAADLQSKGLHVQWAAPVFSNSLPVNGLVRMKPAAGTSVERGYTTVTVTLSKGADWVPVPAIADGASWSDAEAALKDAGLNPVRREVFSDTVRKDAVISMSPSNRQVRGHDVTVTVSKGPETVTIPHFQPFSTRADDAEQQLRDLGLDVKVKKLAGGHFGFFYSVDPGSGSNVKIGSPVTVTVI